MPNRDVSAPYVESNHTRPPAPLGGERPTDASNSDNSYDEAQRAEIAEVEGGGPSDGIMLTDMVPDMGENLDDAEIEDDADGLTQIIDSNTTPD